MAKFDDNGIRFQYPENWRLERAETEDGWTVSVQSPETAFMLISINVALPSPLEMVTVALEALKEEYKDLECEDAVETIAGQAAVGHDMSFTSLDLTNTCWTRAFYSGVGTVLVLCQCNDMENELNEQVLRAMCKSLEADE